MRSRQPICGRWFALRTNLLLLGRLEEAVQDFLRFEPGAPLSAELVVTGLMLSRLLGAAGYESEVPAAGARLAVSAGDQADLAAVTISRIQYRDLPRDSDHAHVSGLQPAAAGQSRRLGAACPRAGGRRHHPHRLPVGRFPRARHGPNIARVIAAHDRAHFSVHLYSLTTRANEDKLSAEFRALAQAFTDLAELDDFAAARSIAADGIDILVDLMGHSA